MSAKVVVINMYRNTFTGYNCFSSAVGEYARIKGCLDITDILQSQWIFSFDKELFWKNCWYAGASLLPVDHLLKQDLMEYANVSIKEYTSTKAQALIESKEAIKRNKAQIILVDFYYLDSVNWEAMRRFQVYPQHDSHFIILTKINEDTADFIDPYYNYKGSISLVKLNEARNHQTKQGNIVYHSYDMVLSEARNDRLLELIKYRFERFLKEKMYYQMEEFAIEVDKKRLIEGKNQNRNWALDGYNSLRSIVEQRSNLSCIQEKHSILLPPGLELLENRWSYIRKKLFEFYNNGPFHLEEISYEIFETSLLEKKYAKEVVNSILE
jgi:hypothetical protein